MRPRGQASEVKRMSLMAAVLAFMPGIATGAPKVAPKVASTALCGDQLVATLVTPDRIAAVSSQSLDPTLSKVADIARTLPVMPASAEAFLWSGAEIVVGSDRGDIKTLALMERLGAKVVRMTLQNSFADSMRQLRQISTALGVGDAGEALATDAEKRLRDVTAAAPAVPVLVAYYRPDGGSSAQGTFVNEALELAGYRNLAAHLGRKGWGRLDMETLVLNPPEALVAAYFDRPGWSLRHKFTHHPVFRQVMADRPTIAVPGALIACSGWPLIDGIEFLAHARPSAGTTP